MTTRKQRGMSGAADLLGRRPAPAPAAPATPDANPAPTFVSALRGGAGQGWETVAVTELAEHPDNPRDSLGDLSDLTESVRTNGILQPLLVVPAAVFTEQHPHHAATIGSASWVVVIGHRRRAASIQAGLERVPVIVRTDLDRAQMAETFLVENIHRRDLQPLEEARGLATLVDLGLTQRQVAQRTSISQGTVSKRLALLRLPVGAQDAIASGALSASLAERLTGLDSDVQQRAWDRVSSSHQGELGMSSWALDQAIRQARDEIEAEAKATTSRAQLVAEKVTEVDPARTFGARTWDHLLTDQRAITRARQAGTLVASVDSRGAVAYYTVDEPLTKERPASREEVDARHRLKANKHRKDAVQDLTAHVPPAKEFMALMCQQVATRRTTPNADALKLVHGWLNDQLDTVPAQDTSYRWEEGLSAASPAETQWVAWAYWVASAELSLRSPYRAWTAEDAAFLRRLMEQAHYEPTSWELERLAAAAAPPGAPASPPGEHVGRADSDGITDLLTGEETP